jgi:hypothetical protein
MNQLFAFENAHPAIVAIACYVVFMAIVAGMPEPGENVSVGYKWLFTSLHILAVNINFFAQKKGLPVLPGQALQAQSTTTPDGTTQSTLKITAAEPTKGGQ